MNGLPPATGGKPVPDWQPRPALSATVMEGRTVRLEPLDPARHASALWPALGGPENAETWRYMPDEPFLDEDGFADALARTFAARADWHTLVVCPHGGPGLSRVNACAQGLASYMRLSPENGTAEVGAIAYGAALRRTTAATEAMYLMAEHAFAAGYRRYEWKCNALNAASKRAALRLGFTYEGTFRNHMVVKGLSRDTAWFSLTDAEWPARKARLENWLEAAMNGTAPSLSATPT